MKKAVLVLIVLAASVSAYGYYTYRGTTFVPEISFASLVQGDVVDTVGATGALEAVTTVNVGSQVSGIIQELNVDYNSIVRSGDVIMRLDPSLFETQIEQARANLVRAQADLERLRVEVDASQTQLTRTENLAARQLVSATELEAAQVALRSAQAQLKSAEAAVTQAEASLNQNEVNLEHTVIRAPIDGIIISRLVDVGQTVAASLQAPELFVIAADLTKMRVIANIDESDVGRIRPNQRVTFTVDAYPGESFEGHVSQIRLEPVVTQNVVTYATVIDAPNPDLKLKPGMTATITLEIARREDVLRIPNSALRFRPTPAMFAVLNQPVPDILQPGGGATPDGPLAAGGRTEREFDPERAADMRERFAQMTPEAREQMLAARGGQGRRPGGAPPAFDSRAAERTESVPTVDRGATTIDALFAPLELVESAGQVWIMDGEQLRPVRVRLGLTDGTATELIGALGPDDALAPGAQLVTNVSTPEGTAAPTSGLSGSPLAPQPFGFRR